MAHDSPTSQRPAVATRGQGGSHGGGQADAVLRVMAALVAAVLVLAALAVARAVFAPLAFALLIIALVWPLQARLQAVLPKLLALALTMAATVLVVGAFGWTLSWGFSRVVRFVVADVARFQAFYDAVAAQLESHGIVVASLWAEHFNPGWVIALAQQVGTRVNGLLSFTVVVLVYVMLGLLEVEPMARRLRRMGERAGGALLLAAGARTGAKFRRYMLVRSLMSAVTGVLVWAFLSLFGLPLAAEWGVIAFAFNYIPFMGPLVATVLPTLFAVAQFDAWQNVVILFACLNLIQFLVGSYLEPMIAGSVLAVPPFVVLFAVFFWTFLWGIAGAFIGVPIVVALVTLCEAYPSSRWVAELLGGGAVKV